MIRKYLLDILCIALVSAVAIVAAERPAVDLRTPLPSPGQKEAAPPPSIGKKEEPEEMNSIARYAHSSRALKERNIFSADGKYAMPGKGAEGKGPPPENPYTLIGILQGEEKKAVFRDYTGAIATLTVGKELLDGSVITRIHSLSVEIRKGRETRELRIFNIKTPEVPGVRKPGR